MTTTDGSTRRSCFGEDNDGCGTERTEAQAKPDSTTSTFDLTGFRLIPFYTDEQLARARDVLRDAETWRLRNPQAWRFIVQTARKAHDGGQVISGRQLVEAVRKRDLSSIDGKRCRLNNNYAAVVARWLAKEYPELREALEFRTTALDAIMGA